MSSKPILSVENLSVKFALRTGTVSALSDINFTLNEGERLGIVGESGAGKSVAGFSILNLISKPGYISNGSIIFEGEKLNTLSEEKIRAIRGDRIGMIFQDPMMTLNPVLTIGTQLTEALLTHRTISFKEAKTLAIETLRKVYIPSPEKRFNQYPHELSGGMRQRVVIACALILDPKLIIADEPTTALDVTIQAEIMAILEELCEERKMGLILITHDLAVVSQLTHRTAVMYAGRIIEINETSKLISKPVHPYTQGLLKSLPRGDLNKAKLSPIPGNMPTLNDQIEGCSFNPRCSFAQEKCFRQIPPLTAADNLCHQYACFYGNT